MTDPRIMRLHLEMQSVPQIIKDDETLNYFWYSVASCIACHKPEWLNDEMMEFIDQQERDGDD